MLDSENGARVMMKLAALLLAARHPTVEHAGPLGRWVFVGALALLLMWLIFMPGRLIGQTVQKPPWWRNVRVWAIVVCGVQLVIYVLFA